MKKTILLLSQCLFYLMFFSSICAAVNIKELDRLMDSYFHQREIVKSNNKSEKSEELRKIRSWIEAQLNLKTLQKNVENERKILQIIENLQSKRSAIQIKGDTVFNPLVYNDTILLSYLYFCLAEIYYDRGNYSLAADAYEMHCVEVDKFGIGPYFIRDEFQYAHVIASALEACRFNKEKFRKKYPSLSAYFIELEIFRKKNILFIERMLLNDYYSRLIIVSRDKMVKNLTKYYYIVKSKSIKIKSVTSDKDVINIILEDLDTKNTGEYSYSNGKINVIKHVETEWQIRGYDDDMARDLKRHPNIYIFPEEYYIKE